MSTDPSKSLAAFATPKSLAGFTFITFECGEDSIKWLGTLYFNNSKKYFVNWQEITPFLGIFPTTLSYPELNMGL